MSLLKCGYLHLDMRCFLCKTGATNMVLDVFQRDGLLIGQQLTGCTGQCTATSVLQTHWHSTWFHAPANTVQSQAICCRISIQHHHHFLFIDNWFDKHIQQAEHQWWDILSNILKTEIISLFGIIIMWEHKSSGHVYGVP